MSGAEGAQSYLLGSYVSGGVTPWKMEYCDMTRVLPLTFPHIMIE